MKHTINNNEYKILYLDTNALTYFIKYDEFAEVLLTKYVLNKYTLATNVFNVMELYQTEPDFHDKIQKKLDDYPLLILNDYVNIVNTENKNRVDISNLVLFAVGIKPLFQVSFSDFKIMIEQSSKQIEIRQAILNREKDDWRKKKTNSNPQWQRQYNKNMKETMDQLLKSFKLDFQVDVLGKYKSLECMAFIKNKFCNEKPTDLIKNNSILDMYNVAVYPYVDAYITERTVGSWLKEFTNKCTFQCPNVLLISDIYKPSKK